jgi:hypothetical protein
MLAVVGGTTFGEEAGSGSWRKRSSVGVRGFKEVVWGEDREGRGREEEPGEGSTGTDLWSGKGGGAGFVVV